MRRKKNYLNNKDMLAEIHKSKISYCEYDKNCPEHAQHDVIVESLDEILLHDTINLARKNRASRIADLNYNKAYDIFEKDKEGEKPKLSTFKFDPSEILIKDLVFRVIDYSHIPAAPSRKKNPKSVADLHVKLNFIPFKHYIIETDELATEDTVTVDQLKQVLQSHTKDGKFNMKHGAMTNKLAQMYLLMVNKYSQRSNWRGYTYLDEMKGHALLQLSGMGLQFNEAKSDNPFSYYTASISNSFTGVLNTEKKNQNIRDDLLTDAGINPSFSRQLEIEEEIRKMRDAASADTTE